MSIIKQQTSHESFISQDLNSLVKRIFYLSSNKRKEIFNSSIYRRKEYFRFLIRLKRNLFLLKNQVNSFLPNNLKLSDLDKQIFLTLFKSHYLILNIVILNRNSLKLLLVCYSCIFLAQI